jgi:uncharacterized protein involved in exopolysaccharide biosynthesis
MDRTMSLQSPSIILGQRISPTSEENTTSDLQQLVAKVVSILRYRRWLFVMPLLAGTMAVLAVCLVMPRQYTMRALFERRDDPVLIKLVAGSPYNFDSLRRTARFNLIGPAALEKAVDELGLVADFPEAEKRARRQAIVARVQPQLGVYTLDTAPNFDLIEVRYTGDEPDLGEKLVNLLKNNYIRQTQAFIVGLQQQAQKFFADEVDKRRQASVRMQAELTQILINQPELDPSRPDWLKERLTAESLAVEQLNRQKNEMLSDIQTREEYLTKLAQQQKDGKLPNQATFLTKPLQDPQRARLDAQMTTIMSEIADAKTIRHMKDSHPYIESLNKKLKQLRVEFERLPQEIAGGTTEVEAGPTPWDTERNRVDMELKTARSKLAQIEQDLVSHRAATSELEAQRATVFDRQQQFMMRQQELDNLKSDLSVWQNRLEEINRALAAENSDRGTRLNTIEECRRPAKPTTPKLSTTYMLSGGIGLALAVAAVFLREIFDRSFRNPARVRQALGIPVLETIGEITVGASGRRWARKVMLPTAAAVQVVLILLLGSVTYISLEHPEVYAGWLQALAQRSAVLAAWLG